MKLSDYVVEFLKNEGITTIFGYQGGAITHLVDSIYENKDMEFVPLYHEQAAAFAAEGYSRISGNFGVTIATSGPGATNLITGIGSSFFDSIPCLYITGQVNTYEYKRNESIRQEGFQETDIVNIVKPITKFAVMIKDANKIKYFLEKVVHISKNGRPGPVLIDIPMDIQRADIDPNSLESFYSSDEYLCEKKESSIDETIINSAVEYILNSKRPIIHIGGGIRLGNAIEELDDFSTITGIPVVTTLMGIDSINHYHPNFVGYMGSYGNRYANIAVANSDLLLVLGARLTSRQTSTNVKSFAREAKIIHVDIDKNELNLKLNEDLSINCDVKLFLKMINEKLKSINFKPGYEEWKKYINDIKEAFPSYPTQKKEDNIDPNELMNKISEVYNEDTIFCLDIGQNQIWASQSMKLKKGQRMLNAGGMGPMGFALPSAIGAFKADSNKRIVAIAGDGGIQMNIQEFQTIVRDNIPIKIFIVNNKALGMIRHFQELYFDSRYYGTIQGYTVPDFVKVAEAYGIKSIKVNNESDLNLLEDKLLDNQSYVFNIMIDEVTYVIPKLGVGKPIEEQEPLIDREILKRHMIIDFYEE